MNDTLRLTPGIWHQGILNTDLQRGFATSISVAADQPQRPDTDLDTRPPERAISLSELDIDALTDQILELLNDPHRTEFMHGSPESSPIISIHDGPFVIAEITVLPAQSDQPNNRLVLKVIPPILSTDQELTPYTLNLTTRARTNELRLPSNNIQMFTPKFDLITNFWTTDLISQARSYVFRNKERWFEAISRDQMSEDMLREEQELFWNEVMKTAGKSLIQAGIYQDFFQIGFVNSDLLRSIKDTVSEEWKSYAKNFLARNQFSSFPSQLLSVEMISSSRSRADFPDRIECRVVMSRAESEKNKLVTRYIMAQLKAAVGLWQSHPDLAKHPLAATGMLYPPLPESSPATVVEQKPATETTGADRVKRSMIFASLGR